MGCWGMGIAQTDGFCEVYEQFMEAYDEGESVCEITRTILEDYRKEFDDTDGVMHDVFFALAKAEWMCCEQSPEVLSRVKEIIDSGENLCFYNELGASQRDLVLRKKNLDKFWTMLQESRATPRRRSKKSKAAMAVATKGLVFWYKVKGLIYGAILLEILPNGSMLVALSNCLASVPKTVDEVLDADAYTAAWFDALLPASRVHEIGMADVFGTYNGRAGMYHTDIIHFCENYGVDSHWCHEKCALKFDNKKMRDLLNSENVPAEFRDKEHFNKILQSNRPIVWISP